MGAIEQMDTDKDSQTLLVIDDDHLQLTLLTALLTRSGFKVMTAIDGFDGLNRALSDTPDLILCDVTMPPPDGFLLKQWLSKDAKTAAIPFIFLTARDEMEDKLEGLSSGADDYITKPFQARELIERIRAVMRRHRVSRQQAMTEAGQTIAQLSQFLNMTAQLVGHGEQVVEQIEIENSGSGIGSLSSRDSFERQIDSFATLENQPIGLLVLKSVAAEGLSALAEVVMRTIGTLGIGPSDYLLFKVGQDELVLLLPRGDASRVQFVRQHVEVELERMEAAARRPTLGLATVDSETGDSPSAALHRAEAMAGRMRTFAAGASRPSLSDPKPGSGLP